MAFSALAEFLEALDDAGELTHISAEVDPDLELAAIADRVAKAGGAALLFENVRGYEQPVVANLLGTTDRLRRAWGGAPFAEIADRIASLLKPSEGGGWLERLAVVPRLGHSHKHAPKVVSSGSCQQVLRLEEDVNLQQLPALTCWPGESGRMLTAGQVYTRCPESATLNLGQFPLQVLDERTAAVHWHWQHESTQDYISYRQQRKRMPVAVCFGGDPLLPFVASAPMPTGANRLEFAGFLRQSPLEMVTCRTHELEVPAGAEIVLEGYIDAAEENISAGPIGLETGYYSVPDAVPRLHVTAVTHRNSPLMPAMIPARPPAEASVLGEACEGIFLPLVQAFIPELVDYHFPGYGAWHNFAFISLKKSFAGQARKVASAMWGLGQFWSAKILVLLDADVNVHDEREVWFHVGANVHPGRDVFFQEGPTDARDHASPVAMLGHKLGIDATAKLPEEHPRPWPDKLAAIARIEELLTQRWEEYGLSGLAPPKQAAD